MTIQIMLAATASIACMMAMLRLFWVEIDTLVTGSATVPILAVGETVWFGANLICYTTVAEQQKRRDIGFVGRSIIVMLAIMLAIQILIPLRLLSAYAWSIAG